MNLAFREAGIAHQVSVAQAGPAAAVLQTLDPIVPDMQPHEALHELEDVVYYFKFALEHRDDKACMPAHLKLAF